jgi:methyl-accepting chemotaxis protein
MKPSGSKFAMSLASRLVVIIIIALVSMTIIGGFAIRSSLNSSANAERTIEDRFQEIVIVGELRSRFVLVDALVKKAPLELDLSVLENDRAEFRTAAGELKARLREFQANSGKTENALQVSEEKTRFLAEMVAGLDQFVAEAEKMYGFSLQFAQREALEVLNGGAAQARSRVENAIRGFTEEAKNDGRHVINEIVESRNELTWTTIAIAAVLFSVVLFMSFIVVRAASRALRDVRAMTGVTGSLAGGDMDVQIPGGDRRDEIGEMARSLEQIRAVGLKAARAQSSLDDASSPMMIVDVTGTVIFPNKAMTAFAAEFGNDLAAQLKGFAETSLVGVPFDELHNLEAFANDRLMEIGDSTTSRMRAGGRTIDLTASPVYNGNGDRIGSVVEWIDKTDQVAVEKEIADIVHLATEGDFSQRLTEADKDGFMADLASGMNELLNVIDNGLSQVVKVVGSLAEGDLSRRMQGEHRGAFGTLKADVDRMSDRIEEIVGRIAKVSGAVQIATNEISSGITDLSGRTEHQASSLEETTASMQELSATVRQNADNAQEANQVAGTAREVAVRGGGIVEETVRAMSGIEASSRKITEIVGLIQEIAFQTNLLALNASVEAARAGESGRGFSVVANEVRALAQRAASASKDIKELIVNSDEQVQEGVRLVGEAGLALDEIVTSVKKVADYVSDIAAASREQTSGIDQVSNAISAMDEMTQQNASLVEETTGTISSAQGQMQELQEAVGFFNTAELLVASSEDMQTRTAPEPGLRKTRQAGVIQRVAGGSASAVAVEPEWQEF